MSGWGAPRKRAGLPETDIELEVMFSAGEAESGASGVGKQSQEPQEFKVIGSYIVSSRPV